MKQPETADDFEDICAAYWAALRYNDGLSWSYVCERRLPVADEIRRGMAAALRRMRRKELAGFATDDHYFNMIDELLRQAEADTGERKAG